MGILDFKEIPAANSSDGTQDSFELFTRELLKSLGFSIIENPDRGQDGGRDLIVSEKRQGIINDTEVRWLVSCKHKAHSGSAVTIRDEADLYDRVSTHHCNGFMGVYSTVVSSSLSKKFASLSKQCEVKIFDHESLENILLTHKEAHTLIKRFFPNHCKSLKTPSNLLSEYSPLRCRHCGKDLLQQDVLEHYQGIVVFVIDANTLADNGVKKYVDVYCCCKGECDRHLEYAQRLSGYLTGWDDISDLTIPSGFIRFLMAILNNWYSHEIFLTEKAFESLKEIIISLSQIVMKDQTATEIERMKRLSIWE